MLLRNSAKGDPVSEERIREILSGEFGLPTNAGPIVNEKTAMKVSAFYRCVSLIAGTLASLPCEVRRIEDGTDVGPAYDHPAYQLVSKTPNVTMTANTFWKTFIRSGCNYGDCYALIARGRNGDPRKLLWLPYNRVSVQWSPDFTRLQYKITLEDGKHYVADQDDMIHYPFFGFDGKNGKAPLQCARESLGMSQAAEEFNAKFFTEGSGANLLLKYPGAVTMEQATRIMEVWQKTQAGNRLPHVVTDGGEAQSLGFNAEQTQLIASRYFQVEDICRFFGVPPHMVGHITKSTSWGSGIEGQSQSFVRYVLRDYAEGIEQELERKLCRSGRFAIRFNFDSLLRADTKARSDYYRAALGGNQLPGYFTVNEVRRMEGHPPIPGGDVLYTPQQDQGVEEEETQTPAPPEEEGQTDEG